MINFKFQWRFRNIREYTRSTKR